LPADFRDLRWIFDLCKHVYKLDGPSHDYCPLFSNDAFASLKTGLQPAAPGVPKEAIPCEVLRQRGAAPSSLREFHPIVELIEEARRSAGVRSR